MKLEDILDENDALTAYRIELSRLRLELRKTQEATAAERDRAEAALGENRRLRGLLTEVATHMMTVGRA